MNRQLRRTVKSRGRPGLLVLLALSLALVGCAADSEISAGPLELIDGDGRQVSLAGPAQRIVSLAPSNTELLYAIGAGPQLVGRDEVSDYPAEVLEVDSIGSTYGELNTEAILALEPDLVLAASITAPEQIQALEALGITTFVIADPVDFAALYENIRTVGKLTGHDAEAEEEAESLKQRVRAVTDAIEGSPRLRVYYEVDGTDPSAPWTTGEGTFQQLLINLAGGTNVAGQMQGWGQISLEELVAQDPQVVLFGFGPWVPTTTDSVAERPGWAEMAAVKAGQVYAIDTNWIDRPGPRLVDALEAMAQAIHPDLFD
jgi:iron complex transport system substrate-binding protein